MSQEHQYDEEITLKELILKIQEYFREIIKNWWVIGLASLFTTAFFLYKHFTHVPEYTAEIRFVVEGQGGVSGGLGGLLGSFGIKKGGSVNPYKILEVGKSSKLFEDVVFSRYGKDSTVADKLLSEYELVKKWSKKNEKFNDFYFRDNLLERPLERTVFKNLKGLVWGTPEDRKEALSNLSLDEEKGIYSLKTSTTDEKLSMVTTNRFYQGIKGFFEDEIFENQQRSAEILAAKADSINDLRTSKIYKLARFEDKNRGLIYKENSSQKAVLTQEIQALGMAYAELIKNYEMTDVNLKDLQPLFMQIDRPFLPLKPSESSLLKNLFLGMFLGSGLGTVFIIARKAYQEVME